MAQNTLVPGAAAQLLLEWAGAEISPVTRQLAATVVALEADLITLLSYHVVPCSGDPRRPDRWAVPGMPELWACPQPLAFEVTWGDRTAYCCPFHLEAVRWAAANDSAEARTDTPHVQAYSEHPLVARWWATITREACPL